MAQEQDFRTYQLYQKYHKLIYNTPDNQTYSYFTNFAREMAANQPDVLIGYIKSMIEDIIKDINTHGDCWLLQAIVDKTLPAIHVLDYSAVLYVFDSVFAPTRRQTLNTRTIPYTARLVNYAGDLLFRDLRAGSMTLGNRQVSDFDTKCIALLMFARNKITEANNKALNIQVNALNEQLNILFQQLGQVPDDGSTKYAVIRTDNDSEKNTSAGYSELLLEQKKMIFSFQTKVKERDKQLSDLHGELCALKAQFHTLNSNHIALKDEHQAAEETIQELRQQNALYQKNISQLLQYNENLAKQLNPSAED